MPFAVQGVPSPDLIRKTSDLSVRRQCELLGVTRSKVYYTPKSPDEQAVERKERIMALIDYWHTENPAWGARKIRVLLRNDGYLVTRKTVTKYMREMAIYPIYPGPNTSKRNFKEGIMPYLLRGYVPQFPNQVWSIDITYIKMKRRHMYLTAIIDWYSRMIVGWKLSDTLETAPVLEVVQEAVERHGVPAIINSDQGSQFTSDDYKEFLKSLHIRQSMDGKSRWADNIMIERWFRSLKTEKIYIEEYTTERELCACIAAFVDQYNNVRPHESLEYVTPASVFASSFGLCLHA
jgi:putative transposase